MTLIGIAVLLFLGRRWYKNYQKGNTFICVIYGILFVIVVIVGGILKIIKDILSL